MSKNNDSSDEEWMPASKKTKITTSLSKNNRQTSITQFLSKRLSSSSASKECNNDMRFILKPRLSMLSEHVDTNKSGKTSRTSKRVQNKNQEKAIKYNEQRRGHLIYHGKLKYLSNPRMNPPDNFTSFPEYLPNYSTAIKFKDSFDCFSFKSFCGIHGCDDKEESSLNSSPLSSEIAIAPENLFQGTSNIQQISTKINPDILIKVTDKTKYIGPGDNPFVCLLEFSTFIPCSKKCLKAVQYFSVFLDEESVSTWNKKFIKLPRYNDKQFQVLDFPVDNNEELQSLLVYLKYRHNDDKDSEIMTTKNNFLSVYKLADYLMDNDAMEKIIERAKMRKHSISTNDFFEIINYKQSSDLVPYIKLLRLGVILVHNLGTLKIFMDFLVIFLSV